VPAGRSNSSRPHRDEAGLEGHAQQRNAVRVDLAPLASDAGLESHQRLEGIGRHEALAESLVGTDRKNRRQALIAENTGETERGTAEPPAPRGLRAPRVPLPRGRYYPFPFLGAELPGTGTGAFILPS
jgi:hypothetical protein